MNIEWTLCSERMPPDDGEPIIIKFYSVLSSSMVLIAIFDSTLKMAYFRSFKRRLNSVLWSEFTKEKWEFLNR